MVLHSGFLACQLLLPCLRRRGVRRLQVWIMVIVAVLSATMSESAIDSLQNAIVDNISGTFLKALPLVWTRVLVFVLNIPVIVVSLQVCAEAYASSVSPRMCHAKIMQQMLESNLHHQRLLLPACPELLHIALMEVLLMHWSTRHYPASLCWGKVHNISALCRDIPF